MPDNGPVSSSGPEDPNAEHPSDGHHAHLRVLASGDWAASVTVKSVTREAHGPLPATALGRLCTVLADDLAACITLAREQAAEIGRKREKGQ